MKSILDTLFATAGYKQIPLACTFELSPMCNFTCKMCYIRRSLQEVNAQGGLLPAEFWMDLADQILDSGTLFLLLTGGEPLLYPDFWKLYHALCRKGLKVSINTNASLIDEEAIERFLSDPPERINITLYGGSNESYARLCGAPHGFDRVRRAVQLLHEHGIRLRFNCSLTPDNCSDLEDIIHFAKEFGSGVRCATYMFPPVRRTGQCGDYDARLTPEQAAYHHVYANYLLLTPEVFQKFSAKMQSFREVSDELLSECATAEPGSMHCRAGRSSCWIDWTGCLSACGMFNKPSVSLKEHTFAEAWSEIAAWTREFRYSPVCSNCGNRRACSICPAKVYNETGGFTGRPSYICEMLKYEKQYYAQFSKTLSITHPKDISVDPGNLPEQSCEMDF